MRKVSLFLVLSFLAVAAFARDKQAVTAPGTYKEWGPDIDQVEIIKTFSMADYENVVVLPFDTSKTPMPDKDDKTYEPVKDALSSYTETLVEALRDELKAHAKVKMQDTPPKSPRTLIVRGTVEAINPGSRAKRMLVGYGAGATGNKISGEIVDAKTDTVLVRFTQERRSGGTFKFAGGSSKTVMRDSIHAMGQDIAHILDVFK